MAYTCIGINTIPVLWGVKTCQATLCLSLVTASVELADQSMAYQGIKSRHGGMYVASGSWRRTGPGEIQFNSIQFYLYSAITIQLSLGALQSPEPEPP